MLQAALAKWQAGSREWVEFRSLLGNCPFSPRVPQRSRLASSFGAALALAREGRVEFQQNRPFGAIHLRRQEAPDAEARPAP